MALRADLAEELLAINRLESQTFDLVDDDVREELRRLADEKKAHALVLLGLLQRLDPKFAAAGRSAGSVGGGHERAALVPSGDQADVAQLARASPCHGEGRGFEPHHPLLKGTPRSGGAFGFLGVGRGGGQLAASARLAMAKVVGSSPIIRS